MGVCGENRNINKVETNKLKTGTKNEKEAEAYTGHKQIPIKIINKVLESVCKITVKTKEGKSYGTGFFMNCSDSLKCLMINYHVLIQMLKMKI